MIALVMIDSKDQKTTKIVAGWANILHLIPTAKFTEVGVAVKAGLTTVTIAFP